MLGMTRDTPRYYENYSPESDARLAAFVRKLYRASARASDSGIKAVPFAFSSLILQAEMQI